MDTEFWDAVRDRAHQLWVQEGCIDGRSEAHWQQAQQDVLGTMNNTCAPAEPISAAEAVSSVSCTEVEAEDQTAVGAEGCTPTVAGNSSTLPKQQPSKGTSLLKLKLRQCRYVISDTCSPAICCGAPTQRGSWCEEHRARVFVRSSARAPLAERAARPQIEKARF